MLSEWKITRREKMAELSAELYEQMTEAEELDAAIRLPVRVRTQTGRNLEVLGYGEECFMKQKAASV